MEGAYYFTYETVNFTKMKYYIGQHCTKDLNDGYFGSSEELIKDIKSGDDYEVNIISFYNNIYDLGYAEHSLIKERNCLKDKDYYNLRNRLYFNETFEYGQTLESNYKNRNSHLGKKHNKESKLKNSIASKKWHAIHGFSKETKTLISINTKNTKKMVCPYCGKLYYPWTYVRYGGVNCKNNKNIY